MSWGTTFLEKTCSVPKNVGIKWTLNSFMFGSPGLFVFKAGCPSQFIDERSTLYIYIYIYIYILVKTND